MRSLVTVITVAVTWLALTASSVAQHRAVALTSPRVPPCSASGVQHERWAVKNRVLDGVSPVASITVTGLIAQPMPPQDTDRDADQPVSAFERTTFSMMANVCLIKQSADDCDLHLELAATPQDCRRGPRVIVEVPASAGKVVQETALDAVGLARLGKSKHEFADPPSVGVVGLGFFDLSHRCGREPIKGCQHGSAAVATITELHPARIVRER